MQPKSLPRLPILFLAAFSVQLSAAPVGTAFTYQGRLASSGQAASGTYDFQFTLYDAQTLGSVVGGPVSSAGVVLSNGLFTVSLDFGSTVFDGSARWLEIAVRTNGAGSFTTLSPRQALTASPYALYSPTAGAAASLTGTLPADELAGLYPSGVNFNNPSNLFSGAFYGQHYGSLFGSFYGDGSGLFNLNAGNLAAGTVPDARLSGDVALLPAVTNIAAYQAQLATNPIPGIVSNIVAANTATGLGALSMLTNVTLIAGSNSIGPVYAAVQGTNLFVYGSNAGTNGVYWLTGSTPDGNGCTDRTWTNGAMQIVEYYDPQGFNCGDAFLSNSVSHILVAEGGDYWTLPAWNDVGAWGSIQVCWTTNTVVTGLQVSGAFSGNFAGNVLADSLSVTGKLYGDLSSASNAVCVWSNLQQVPMSLWQRADPANRTFSTPSLGFGSWNDYGYGLTETDVLALATNFTTYGLKAAGYTVLIVDTPGWTTNYPNGDDAPLRDPNHVLQANTNLFPHGMQWLATTLHAMGFKMGIYEMAGIGDGYPEIDAATFASWGVDYIDLDSGALTLNTGANTDWLPRFALTAATLCKSNSQPMIRIFGHVWGSPQMPTSDPLADIARNTDPIIHQILDIRRDGDDLHFITSGYFNGTMGNGAWYSKAIPKGGVHLAQMALLDPDMLHTVHMQMAGSVLMSADLTLDAGFNRAELGNFTNTVAYQMLPVLTNSEALAIHHDPALAMPQQIILRQSPLAYAWIKPLGSTRTPTEWAVALVNEYGSGVTNNVTFNIDSLPTLQGIVSVRDVWNHQTWLAADLLTATNLEQGDVMLYRISPP